MLSRSPINLSIMNKIKIKLFLLPLRVQSTIHLQSFMGATNPHNFYVIKIGSWFPKDCKMSHAVVSPHSMPPRNQSNKKIITQHFYKKIISTWNSQANAMVQCAHQMLGNLIKSFELQENLYLNLDDLWSDILAAASFAMRSMYHITLHDAWPARIWEGYDT